MLRNLSALAPFLLLVISGCSMPSDQPLQFRDSRVTWHNAIHAIAEEKCSPCHYLGPSAPAPDLFSNLTTAQYVGPLIMTRIKDGTMPPWMPSHTGSVPFLYDRSLSPAQYQAFIDWESGGFPMGDSGEYIPPSMAVQGMPPTADPDLVITLPTPTHNGEEYLCYNTPVHIAGQAVAWQWEYDGGHHIGAVTTYDATPAGWFSCPGGVAATIVGSLSSVGAGYAKAYVMPYGVGLPMTKGMGLVITLHALSAQMGPIRLKIWLDHSGQPLQRMLIWGFVGPVEVPPPEGPSPSPAFPASREYAIAHQRLFASDAYRGDINATLARCGKTLEGLTGHLPIGPRDHYYVTQDCIAAFAAHGAIESIQPHMHYRGAKVNVKISHLGQWIDIITIDKWRFRWEEAMHLAKPQAVDPGDLAWITCTFDNGEVPQRSLDGTLPSDYPAPAPRQLPRYVTGGTELDEDMCSPFFGIVLAQ